MHKTIFLLHLHNVAIFDQLKIEEALLHLNEDNWCIINEGSRPSIVLGISGDPKKLINLQKFHTAPLPLIKRFSGGGAVVVDDATLFVSFIFQQKMHDFPCHPEPIFHWSEGFYKEALSIPKFHLREHDYVIGNNKCGGNAQYIKKRRFVHHSTFLWDYEQKRMDYLLHPPKSPDYRKARTHSNFLCRLKNFCSSKSHFVTSIKKTLSSRYNVYETSLEEITPILQTPHRKAASLINIEPYLLH